MKHPPGRANAEDKNGLAGSGPWRWVVCQLGSREHYAVPQALMLAGCLEWMVTDIWHNPSQTSGWRGLLSRLAPRLTTRFEPALDGVHTKEFSTLFVGLALLRRLGAASERWRDFVTGLCDGWYQRLTARWLARQRGVAGQNWTVFAYSYSARRIFQLAKQRGWFTVLGQINPGPREEEIVREVYQREFGASVMPPQASAAYWRQWREECTLADAIVVNSPWASHLLIEAGIAPDRLHIIPLAYERPAESESFQRSYPACFTAERPLRVLYLGAAHPRKGILVLLRVAAKMAAAKLAVEFLVVGRDEVPGGLESRLSGNVHRVAEVDRRATAAFYRQADIFVLPTYSDGFALTLLEAQAWKLPAIVSEHCGRVIEHDQNGIVLAEVGEADLEHAILFCLNAPESLRDMSARAVDFAEFSLASIGARFQNLAPQQ